MNHSDQDFYSPTPDIQPMPPRSNGLAVASMVLGIISIVFGWCCCPWLGFIVGIVGIVLACISQRKPNRKMDGRALAGLICSIFGMIGTIIDLIITPIVAEQLMPYLEQYFEQIGLDLESINRF